MAQDFADLLQMHVVAVVGCSSKEERPSFQAASYLKDAGYRSPEAVEKARRKGLKVVVNDCFMRRHVSRLGR